MSARVYDRAGGCRAELEVANRRLGRTPNYCTAGHPAVRYEGGLDCPICGMRRTIAKMRPVYEQMRAVLLRCMQDGHFYDCLGRGREPDDDRCSRVCNEMRAALAADRDREMESE